MIQLRNDFKVELIDSMGDDARVVQAARVSTMNDDVARNQVGLIRYLLRNGHWSPFEHVYFTFRSEVPIFLSRQLLRHKSMAFNEMSMRYSEALPHFYMPDSFNKQSGTMKQGRAEPFHPDYQNVIRMDREKVYADAWALYQKDIEDNMAKEQAREVLPVSVYTVLYTTMNLRSLLHFVGERTDPTAQTEAQAYAGQIRDLVKDIVPVTMAAWEEINAARV